MKKTVLTILGILMLGVINGQENFVWDKVDSIPKSKSQIYSDTKLFIAEYWKSSQDVTQNSDKEGGVILVKGSSIQKSNHKFYVFTYVYNYTVTFRMKDNKYKITIDNVYCDKAFTEGVDYSILKIPPFDGAYKKEKTGMFKGTLPEKKATKMMDKLKYEMESIINNYQVEIESNSDVADDW